MSVPHRMACAYYLPAASCGVAWCCVAYYNLAAVRACRRLGQGGGGGGGEAGGGVKNCMGGFVFNVEL
jgi:hypothetical protein